MKLKTLVFAVAALGAANSAFAVDPFSVPTANVVHISGATATDGLLNRYLAGEDLAPAGPSAGDFDNAVVCVNGTQTWINIQPGQPSSGFASNWGVACTAKAGVTGLTAGQDYLFLKHGTGGSGSGTTSVASNVPVTYPAITAANCPASAPTLFPLLDRRACTANENTTAIPDFGISDIEPRAFIGNNTPEVGGPFPAAANLDVYPTLGVIFGFPVTQAFYNALQTAQINKGFIDPACVVGSTTENCRPSLSKNTIKALFTRAVTSAANIQVGGQALCTIPGVSCPASQIVRVCRRVPGSGTQATGHMFTETGQAYWGQATNVLPEWANTNGGGVFLGSGSGDVEGCLRAINGAAPVTINSILGAGGVATTVNVPAGNGQFAIGVNSMERFSREAANGFRYIKVDGAWASGWNVHAGKYNFWGTTTVNCRAGDVGLCRFIGTTAGAEARVGNLNTDLNNPSLVALSTIPGNTGKPQFNPSLPTICWTHTNRGQGASDSRRMPLPLWDSNNTTCTGAAGMPAAGEGSGVNAAGVYPNARY